MSESDDMVQFEQTMDELESRIQELESRIQELESTVEGQEDRIDDLDSTMGEQNDSIEDLDSRVDELESESNGSAKVREEYVIYYKHNTIDAPEELQNGFKFANFETVRELLALLRSSNIIDQGSIKLYQSRVAGSFAEMTELPIDDQ